MPVILVVYAKLGEGSASGSVGGRSSRRCGMVWSVRCACGGLGGTGVVRCDNEVATVDVTSGRQGVWRFWCASWPCDAPERALLRRGCVRRTSTERGSASVEVLPVCAERPQARKRNELRDLIWEPQQGQRGRLGGTRTPRDDGAAKVCLHVLDHRVEDDVEGAREQHGDCSGGKRHTQAIRSA
eukprot:4331565-Prymnesium_polylepis.1